MRKILMPALLLLLGSITLATEVHAEGVYDGIYSTNPDIGYIYIREQQGTLAVVLNQTLQGFYWVAWTGPLNGTKSSLTTILGEVNTSVDIEFTSDTSFQATETACAPAALCIFPIGAQFTATKIW